MTPPRWSPASDAPPVGVAIVGASPQGRVVLAALRAAGVVVRRFVDDDVDRAGQVVSGVPVAGTVDWWLDHRETGEAAVVAVGNNDARLAIGLRLRERGVPLAVAVHPAATVMDEVEVGPGCFVAAGAVLVTGTVLEGDAVVNTGATVDHDSRLEPGAQLAAGVHTAGCVTIGRCAFVGVGASIGPSVTIGAGTVVGAGSVVLDDLPPDVLAFGVPARVVRRLERPLDWRAILARG